MISSPVEKTINYTKFFNSHLTPEDLCLWLISPQTHSLTEVRQFLVKNPRLKKQIISKNNKSHKKRLRLTNKKTKSIKKLINTLKLIPSIKLIALTGSLSINNPKKNDDIDLMIVTSSNTLWLTRPIVIFITSLLSDRRKPSSLTTNNQVCTNLWLDKTSLLVPKKKQNLYTAHEVLQVKSLFDKGNTYRQFIKANFWTKKHLANAFKAISTKDGFKIKRSLVHQASSPLMTLIKTFNRLAFKLQHLYMKGKVTNEHITPHVAYFHPNNLTFA